MSLVSCSSFAEEWELRELPAVVRGVSAGWLACVLHTRVCGAEALQVNLLVRRTVCRWHGARTEQN